MQISRYDTIKLIKVLEISHIWGGIKSNLVASLKYYVNIKYFRLP